MTDIKNKMYDYLINELGVSEDVVKYATSIHGWKRIILMLI